MKKVLFLTGTRADFGKIKSLINVLSDDDMFDIHVFVTGMHMHSLYGSTYMEVERCRYKNIYKYINHTSESTMDLTLAKTIDGLSSYIKENPMDLIVVHGDRVEALAGAIVGSLNNILVAHIEGGELSGTVDELIRHSVSKMSHVHFVSHDEARGRLMQMGECENAIFVIGSPDMDVMFSDNLPSIEDVKQYYSIDFDKYGIVMYHPVTTEYDMAEEHANEFVKALIESDNKYIVIYPNNDLGSRHILKAYKLFDGNSRFKVFPSLRFEYFLTLLKNADFMIGNSSAGVREAPAYGIPSVNIGTRQNNRVVVETVINCKNQKDDILKAICNIQKTEVLHMESKFGNGKSDEMFYSIVSNDSFWNIPKQKLFKNINII